MPGMPRTLCTAVLVVGVFGSGAVSATSVKVTPLGGHEGEFCRFDRAMLFEDPDGTRILYDAGRTVAGADDPRLGKIDALLVSHMHGDHVGDRHLPAPGAGTCEKPDVSVGATPQTNTVAIALAKGAKIVTGSEMPKLFSGKLKAGGGDPKKSQLVRVGLQLSWPTPVAEPVGAGHQVNQSRVLHQRAVGRASRSESEPRLEGCRKKIPSLDVRGSTKAAGSIKVKVTKINEK